MTFRSLTAWLTFSASSCGMIPFLASISIASRLLGDPRYPRCRLLLPTSFGARTVTHPPPENLQRIPQTSFPPDSVNDSALGHNSLNVRRVSGPPFSLTSASLLPALSSNDDQSVATVLHPYVFHKYPSQTESARVDWHKRQVFPSAGFRQNALVLQDSQHQLQHLPRFDTGIPIAISSRFGAAASPNRSATSSLSAHTFPVAFRKGMPQLVDSHQQRQLPIEACEMIVPVTTFQRMG